MAEHFPLIALFADKDRRHMSITLKTHKMLWGRSGNRCAMPDCRKELVMDATETDDESLIGEECHIIAESPRRPQRKPVNPRGKAKQI